ncbi:hypothetical protein C8R44DRAFT_171875 [Mycena epipterygia]|nr:hypothetical protein C8R44DRAFT_171875 [Mycena epipterygia]
MSALPTELEREIFELAALSHSKSIPKFLLVAHRVKIWLEPLLYKVVVFSDPPPDHVSFKKECFDEALHSRALSQYVHHLFISTDLDAILASCSAVQDLGLLTHPIHHPRPSILPLLSAMPLFRLSTTLGDLFYPAPVDFTHALFTHITHLYLLDNLEDNWDDWKGLALLSNLTHLAFLLDVSLPIFRGALTTCPSLKALVLLLGQFSDFDHIRELETLVSLVDDPRFVAMESLYFQDDWQIGARGGENFWVRAENFIARRLAGEINPPTFLLQEESQ